MNEDQLINQIEFRWQPGKDFSATASSLDNKEVLRGWSSRLSKLARPATPNADAGVPESSFVYQTFSDGKAALIWRLYEQDALELFEQPARQPLVARAIIGRSDLLTPDLALALCHMDFAHRLHQPPGQVPIDASLPVIDGLKLIDEFGLPASGQLDALVKKTHGIDSVVATALLKVGKPLSVVLPGSEMIVSPDGSDVLRLLWGLWRVAGPLLASAEGSESSPNWSFSSYEPPLGSSEARDLPIVVFRSQEEERGGPPLSYRSEVTVRPRSANADVGPGGLAARKLLELMDKVGAAQLRGHLNDLVARYPQSSSRLIAIGMLDPRICVPAVDEADQGDPVFEREIGEVTDPSADEDAGQEDFPGTDGSNAAEENSSAEPEPELLPLSLLDALDCLHAGPLSPGFAEAKAFVRQADVPDSAERDQARRQMRARHWYLQPLILDDRWHATDTLEAIVRLAVIPDLTERKVCKLLDDSARRRPSRTDRGAERGGAPGGQVGRYEAGWGLECPDLPEVAERARNPFARALMVPPGDHRSSVDIVAARRAARAWRSPPFGAGLARIYAGRRRGEWP